MKVSSRREFLAGSAVALTGCLKDVGDSTDDNESDINRTDTENRTDEPLNESEYGGETAEGTQVLEENVYVDTPYGDDYSPTGLQIMGGKNMEATVRILEDDEVIYSVTLAHDGQHPREMAYLYTDLIGKKGEFRAEVEIDGEVRELECKTGPGFVDTMGIQLPEVKGCTSPKRANITIRRVTETPDEVELVSSEELSEYDTVEYYVEWYRECKDNPEEKDLCATENGKLDFARGGVSGRSYEEFERIIEKFPSYGSDEDGYPTTEKDGYPAGTYIEHDGEVYVFRMLEF
jgi:hypothetical protein